MPVRQHKPTSNSLRFYRHRQRLKLYQVAHLVGLTSPSHLSHWEKGRKAPSLRNLLKLSIALNVQVSSLYFDLYRELREEMAEKIARSNRSAL